MVRAGEWGIFSVAERNPNQPVLRSVTTMGPTSRRTAALRSLALAALVTGCATRQAFEARMAAFVGRPEGELVTVLGVPGCTYEADGRRFLQ
jgi:hypothetical protein